MEFINKLKLCKEVLFCKTHNPMGVRFKLVGTIATHGVDNLYYGVRLDNVSENDFLNNNLSRLDDTNEDLVSFYCNGPKYNATTTVFRRVLEYSSSGPVCNYYDILDENEKCSLVNKDNSEAIKGCCNVKRLKNYSNLGYIELGKKI